MADEPLPELTYDPNEINRAALKGFLNVDENDLPAVAREIAMRKYIRSLAVNAAQTGKKLTHAEVKKRVLKKFGKDSITKVTRKLR